MADTLVSSFRYCRTSIENQMGERENAIKHALEEFKGNYADLFTKNTRKSMQHAHELIEALRNAEENLKKYIEAAHEEERIRREIKEWEEQEESKRSHGGVTGASGTFNQVGGQAVLGRQRLCSTPWLTERHGYDPT
ncbi:hypothetical protein [Rothia dentocariosa]|uniref:hypothetical protein n=1 Tax=Rothia dentocariosa TaxID=2047 RepID=UPI003C7A569D